MKKSDLQNFDIVKTTRDIAYMVNTDKGILFGRHGWAPLEKYEDDLTCVRVYGDPTYFDIVQVRRPEQEHQFRIFFWDEAPIIWERRKRTPKLSTFERSFLEKTGMKYMARDKSGNLVFFENMPYRDRNTYEWYPWGGAYGKLSDDIFGELFSFIKWEDESPWSVSKLLEVEG